MKDKKEEISKYLYEKAIKGYEFIIQRYKDWMNLYAIFVGAFFIAYYTLIDKNKIELSLLIIILGLITSACWLYSFLGYYHWQISWVNVLQYHESLFLKNNFLTKDYRLHSLYFQPQNMPLYSSQKIMKVFLWCIIIGWIILFIKQEIDMLKIFKITESLGFLIITLTIFLLWVILSLIFKLYKLFYTTEKNNFLSNKDTMYKLNIDKEYNIESPKNEAVIKKEKFYIKEFIEKFFKFFCRIFIALYLCQYSLYATEHYIINNNIFLYKQNYINYIQYEEGGGVFYIEENGILTLNEVFVSTNTIYSPNKKFLSSGGAIYNIGEFTINFSEFSNNFTNRYGGAIYCGKNNYNTYNIIKSSKFIENYVCNTGDSYQTNAYGGAIYISNRTMIIDSSIFNSNLTVSTGYNSSYGGAIYNYNGTITINLSEFNYNMAKSISTQFESRGGAICNNSGTLQIDSSVFNYNVALSTATQARIESYGGAINNTGTITISSSIFSYNMVNTITTSDSVVDSKSYGGAINNTGTIIISSSIFSYNMAKSIMSQQAYTKSESYGGAINNTGIITIQNGVKFLKNSAVGTIAHGGAICNANIINLIANTGSIEFTGNTQTEKKVSNAIHDKGGIINMWASDEASIIFNDRITSEDSSSIININKSTTTLNATGKIILNEDMSGYAGKVNILNGEIELKAKPDKNNINTNNFFNGNINFQNGTLNILNNSIDNITIENLTMSTQNSNLKFDVDLSNNTSDNFRVKNTVSGELNLIGINIIGISKISGQITLFIGNSPMLNVQTNAVFGGYEYNFTNSLIKGILNYKRGAKVDLKNTISKTTPAIRSYSLAENETVMDNLGSLGGEELTLFGNGYDINGNSNSGIIVRNGQILNIENVNSWNGFNEIYGAIQNEGILNISNTNFNNNEKDIINNGNLTLNGVCYFETGITGNGTITINGNITSNGIINHSININTNAKLINNNTLIVNNGNNNGSIDEETNTSIITITGIFINNGTIKQNKINIRNSAILKLTKNSFLITNNIIVDDAIIEMTNEIVQQHNFKTLTANNTLNLVVDADLQNKQMDTISADSFTGTGNIKVNAINILSDNNEKETTEILFTSSTVLKDKIETVKTVSSKLYKYDVIYNNGYFNFINTGGNKPEINPILLEASIANSVGGFVTQTTIFNQAFASMENIKSRILQVKNEIPVDAPLYASRANTIFFQKTNRIESGLWLRPFYSQERINLDNLPVDNTLTGTLAGLDLATGENSLVSLYLGYAGSEQKYENIKVSQTGYILGATGMLLKEQWYAGVTANINFNKAESQSSYGTDNFDMNMYSVGAKAGYNFDLSDKWILEPNLTLMYGNVNSAEYQTTQGAKVEGQSVANIIFEPQIKAKLNLENGWQPYGLIGYVVNAGDKVTTKVEEVEFDGQKIGNYVEFGAGVDKSFKNSPWSLYIQLTGRSGDRTGFDGNFGIKYSFLTAKEKRKIAKIKKIQERRKAKQEYLKQRRKREIEE